MRVVLQVREFSCDQSVPRAFTPPLVHTVNALPEILLVNAVYCIVAVVQCTAVAFRYF